MGLDTTHNCFHGAYSSFNRWRNEVAYAAGYYIAAVDYDGYKRDTIMIDWGHITEANLWGIWEKTPDDPLMIIIAHQDCEGVIRPEHAGPLADQLEALLPLLESNALHPFLGVREQTEDFINGLRDAASKGEDVEFH